MARALDLVVGAIADDVAGAGEELDQDRDRVGLGVRLDGVYDLAGHAVVGRLGHSWPCDQSDISDQSRLGCGRMIVGRRRYFRQRGDHRAELLGCPAAGKPIRDIPLVGTLGPVLTDIENANPLGDVAQ
jgi:hypothetical protein